MTQSMTQKFARRFPTLCSLSVLGLLLTTLLTTTAHADEAKPNADGQAAPPNEQTAPAQGMTLAKLTAVINNVGDNVEINNNTISFTFGGAEVVAIVAEPANRMRLVSPIIEAKDLTEEQMAATLISNYHLALDARYAVGDGIVYSAFIHPLKELSEEQLLSAIRQVATLRNTFGTTYSSGEMSFGIQTEERFDT